jgi:hypothetical protein
MRVIRPFPRGIDGRFASETKFVHLLSVRTNFFLRPKLIPAFSQFRNFVFSVFRQKVAIGHGQGRLPEHYRTVARRSC